MPMPTKLPRCPEVIDLTVDELAELFSTPNAAHVVKRALQCELESDHDGQHVTLGQQGYPEGRPEQGYGLWMRWDTTARTLVTLEFCPPRFDADGDLVCALPAGHPGAHEQDIE